MFIHPNAKINIGLYVTERRTDGYHNLETVFYPIPLHDVLEIEPLSSKWGDDCDLQITGMPKTENPKQNLVHRVYESLKEEFQLPPVKISLRKNIPLGAGLGGGSSDATATMVLLNDLFQLNLSANDMERKMSTFGADCPFFVRNKASFASGIGNRLVPFDFSLKGTFLLLIKPQDSISTKEAYANIKPQPAPNGLTNVLKQPIDEWKFCIRNDFEESIFPSHPSLEAIKSTLYDMGAQYAQMSGSGSTVFGLFDRPTPEARHVFSDCFVYNKMLP